MKEQSVIYCLMSIAVDDKMNKERREKEDETEGDRECLKKKQCPLTNGANLFDLPDCAEPLKTQIVGKAHN